MTLKLFKVFNNEHMLTNSKSKNKYLYYGPPIYSKKGWNKPTSLFQKQQINFKQLSK